MSIVSFEGARIALDEGESILDGLLRKGHEVPNGCRSGLCHSCVMAMDEGDVPHSAQKGLSDAERALNYFLSCQYRPSNPVGVRRVCMAGKQVDGRVIEKRWLSSNVIRLRIKAPLEYMPGQYVTLWKDEIIARSYSLASHPCFNDYLEVHIKHIPGGKFSPWVASDLEVGDRLGVQGPYGQCFYTARDPEQPVLLAAMGTGLAPIYGILQDAFVNRHKGPITLVVGASRPDQFYLVDELISLADKNRRLDVHLVARESDRKEFAVADVYKYCQCKFADLAGTRVFLCGAESFVRKMRKQCYLSGAHMADISADAFLPFGSTR